MLRLCRDGFALLLLAVSVFFFAWWIRSFQTTDDITVRSQSPDAADVDLALLIYSSSGGIRIDAARRTMSVRDPQEGGTEFKALSLPPSPYPQPLENLHHRGGLGFYFERESAAPDWLVGVLVPYWALVLLSGPVPLIWLMRSRRSRKRISSGRCAACHYDLRASSDRCPECGASIQATQQAVATRSRRVGRSFQAVVVLLAVTLLVSGFFRPLGYAQPPSNLVIQRITPTKIRLDWQGKSPSKGRFVIYEAWTLSSHWRQVATAPAEARSLEVSLLEGDLWYRVTAVNGWGESLGCDPVRIRVGWKPPKLTSVVLGRSAGEKSPTLLWEVKPLDDADDQVEIQRSEKPGLFATIATVPLVTGQFIDKQGSSALAGTYRVRRVRANSLAEWQDVEVSSSSAK